MTRPKSQYKKDFQKLIKDMICATQTEQGTLSFQWFVNENEKTAVVFERYSNEQAANAHLKKYAEKFSQKVSKMTSVSTFYVYADKQTSKKFLKNLKKNGAIILTPQ